MSHLGSLEGDHCALTSISDSNILYAWWVLSTTLESGPKKKKKTTPVLSQHL